jgi:uncharacterized damage-inducible protein DinB
MAITTLLDEALDSRPVDGGRSVTELEQHIVESERMAAGELTRPDGDFQRIPYAAFFREYAPEVADISERGALIALLEVSWRKTEATFRAAGEIFLLQTIRRFDGAYGTRLSWLYHAIEHESYHRGQLALHARLHGITPALTKLIRGES